MHHSLGGPGRVGLLLLLGALAALSTSLVPSASAESLAQREAVMAPVASLVQPDPSPLIEATRDRLALEAGLDPKVLGAARRASRCAEQRGLIEAPPVLAVVDFGLPSTEKRLWVVDSRSGEVLFHEWVAHGKNTGDDRATAFSNIPNSNQSSLGLYRAAEIYTGKHGKSLRLDGLEPGFNDHARDRAIVVHGADYVSEDFVQRVGRLGRSFGCPSVRTEIAGPLIDTLADGAPLFVWHPDSDWSARSSLAGC